nr:MAG TPA: tail tape measure [Caudoviricetes sp.]
MSKTIDEKVVEMRFDNSQFERNVATSMSTIDKLKRSLKFDGISKGIEDISDSANRIDFSGFSNAIDSVQMKFSALEVMAVTALANITNSAVNAGLKLAKSLTIDPISTGWSKYNAKNQSVATMVAQGYDIETVNSQLERLNWFTDETSYDFTQMVANIAKFTATGKDLDESVTAMEGIANWAALSGQNANTASHAMYQLSQAMGAGVMRLEDYKSIQNVSMDTDEFRQKALDAAVALGTLKKNADDTYSSLVGKANNFTKSQFATSLTQGAWFTSDVMMSVFQDYSKAVDQIYDYATEKGITASQAIKELDGQIDAFSLKGFKAAQEARTFEDAINSARDAVSSGWSHTFELIFGNAERATSTWADLAEMMFDIFVEPGNTRNELLSQWSELGGQKALIESLMGIVGQLKDMLDILGEAWSNVFPPMTAERLVEITENFRDFVQSISDFIQKHRDNLVSTFQGLFSVLRIIKDALKGVWTVVQSIIDNSGSLVPTLLEFTGSLGEMVTSLSKSIEEGNIFVTIGEKIGGVLKWLTGLFSGASPYIKNIFSTIGQGAIFVSKVLSKLFSNIKGDVPKLINSLSLASISVFLGKALSGIKKPLQIFSDIKGSIVGVLDGVRDALSSWKTSIDAKSLLNISISIGILAGSLMLISSIESDKLMKSVVAIGALMTELGLFLKLFSGFGGGIKGLGSIAVAMVGISTSVLILASAMKTLSKIPEEDIGRSIAALVGVMAILTATAHAFPQKKMLGVGLAMVSVATAVVILAGAMKIFQTLQWEDIAKGIVAIGGSLGVLALFLTAMNDNIKGAFALTIAAGALITLSLALKIFQTLQWEDIAKGIVAIGGSLGILALFLTAMNDNIKGAFALTIVAGSLIVLGTALKILSSIPFTSMLVALVALAGTFAVLGLAGAILTPVIPTILGLAGALALVGVSILAFGAGLALTGAGLTAIAAGLTALALASTASVNALITVVSAIVTGIIQAILDGITSLVLTIGETLPLIVTTILDLITSILTAIDENGPLIFEKVLSIITGLLEAIANNIQPIVEAGIEIVLGLIRGISEKMDDIAQAGFDLLISFIDGLSKAIDENFTDLLNSVLNLITTIIDSVVEFLTGGAVTDFCASGKAVIEGFIKGMGDMIDAVVQKAKDIAKAAVRTVKGWLGINSPSKVFRKIGVYTGEGLALGLEDSENSIANSAIGVGKTAKTAMEKAINGMSDVVNSIDTQPTIRPILDLSDIESGATRIDKLSDSWNGYSIDGTVNLAKTTMGSLPLQPNSTSLTASMLEQLKKLGNTMSGEKNTTITNHFSITGDNPREIANEVSRILQQQVERRDAVWA